MLYRLEGQVLKHRAHLRQVLLNFIFVLEEWVSGVVRLTD